jgi:uncharacterized protein YggE
MRDQPPSHEEEKMQQRISLAIAAILLIVAIAILGYFAMTPRLAPTPASAGAISASTAQQTTDNTGIFVSGTGKVRIKPNTAYASIGVEITAGTLAEATTQANAKMNALIEKLKGLGIAEKDIQTTNYSINPITTQPRAGATTPTISGYRVNNQVSVTIRKIEDTGKVLDAVVAAGANNIFGISFGVDDPTPYQQQARAAAIKDAQDKAAQLAKAANVSLGKVISISEGVAAPRPVFRSAVADMAVGAAAVPIETGELEIHVSVEVRFAVQ